MPTPIEPPLTWGWKILLVVAIILWVLVGVVAFIAMIYPIVPAGPTYIQAPATHSFPSSQSDFQYVPSLFGPSMDLAH